MKTIYKWLVGNVKRPLLREKLADADTDPTPLQNAYFQFIFVRRASAVTPSKKTSINTNRKLHYALSSEPKMNIARCL